MDHRWIQTCFSYSIYLNVYPAPVMAVHAGLAINTKVALDAASVDFNRMRAEPFLSTYASAMLLGAAFQVAFKVPSYFSYESVSYR